MSTSPTRSLKTLAWLARMALGLVVAAWLVFGASWATLHWVIVPRMSEWQPDIERLASQRLGVGVRIGQIELDGSSAVPAVTLRDIQLLGPDQRPALHLPKVQAALSISSIWRLGFEQLIIDSPVLELRKTSDGQWLLGGFKLALDPAQASDNPVLDWIWSQRELAILNGTLRYVDDSRPQTEALVFERIGWVNRYQGRAIEMRLDTQLPQGWGGALTVQGQFTQPFWVHRAGQWQDWRGEWFAHAPDIDLKRLPDYVNTTPWLGLQLMEGSGAARAWARMMDGQLRQVTLDLGLRTAALQWPGQAAPMGLSALSGRLFIDRDAPTLRVATEALAFTTREGVVWPGGNFRYSQTLNPDNTLAQVQWESHDLDALALFQLAQHMPLPQNWQTELQLAAPMGHIEQLGVRWTRDQGGQVDLRLSQASFNTQSWFSEPRMAFDTLQGRLQWRTAEGLQVQVDELLVKNADVHARVDLVWQQDMQNTGQPGHLKLNAHIDRAQAQRVHRYLPHTVGADVRRYLQHSLKSGQATEGRFVIDGDLAHFPFQQHPGLFEVTAQLQDVAFDYLPATLQAPRAGNWPGLLVRSGQLWIGSKTIEIRNANAHVAQWPELQLPATQARIESYTGDQPAVHVSGPVQGPAADVLRFIQASALDGMLNQALSTATATGGLRGELALDIPLHNSAATRVKGQVVFNNNTLRLGEDIPVLSQTQATLDFDEQGLRVKQARAHILGGPAVLDVAVQGAGAQRTFTVQAKGQVTASGLTQDPALPMLSPLAEHLDGQTSYAMRWSQQGLATRFVLESRLQGVGSRLPAPFQKSSAQDWPLRIEVQPLGTLRTVRDEVTVLLGPADAPALEARYQRERRQGQMQVLRGSVGVNTRSPTLPSQGVTADIRLDTLQTQAWSAGLDPASGDNLSSWIPTTVALQARSIEAGSHTLNQVQLQASRFRNQWDVQLQSQEIQGRINWTPGSERLPGRLQARLARLSLRAGAGDEIDALIRNDPVNVPAIDVVADDFRLDGRSLGTLEMTAVNRPVVEAARTRGYEWRLQQLKLTTPEARLQASGNWAPSQQDPSKRRTAMSFVLEIDDSGLLLARFGMPDLIRQGRGKLEGNLGWLGSPLNFNKTTLAGELALDLSRGQFLKAEPGVARLIGVLNLQSLPRRLALDFRDVFSEGFTFDFVRGNVQVTQGLARTNNLQMKGVTAAVLIEGEADVLRETQDLTAVIIPDLSTGTATLVTTLINPITGISAFVGQFLLRQPLQAATTRQFHVTGTWADPKIVPVNRLNLPQNGGSASTPSMRTP